MALRQGVVWMRGSVRRWRIGMHVALAALVLAIVVVLTPISTAHAVTYLANETGYPGAFGVDSCTPLKAATTQGMPTQFYVAELGAGAHSLDCVERDVIKHVGQDFVHSYWGLTGPNGAADPYAYGQRQARAALDAWQNIPGIAGITIFADVEYGFGGWARQPTATQQTRNTQLLNGFLTTIAQAQFIPGVYINNSNKATWFPDDYIAQVPFVYWVAGGPLSGKMPAPCNPNGYTLPPVIHGWQSTVSQTTFAGQKAELWQYWLSDFGCSGDFVYTAQTGYHAFLPNV
ncbi:MAG TPA: hypothetical protein VFU63_03885 [Ktedonobacterales bacterium]|nr:hypothetical protein [Ktedonobacterales bacterium]